MNHMQIKSFRKIVERIHLLFCTVIFSFAVNPVGFAQDSVCSDINVLLGHAKNKFSSIKGPWDPYLESWHSSYVLPNAECGIDDEDDAWFFCDWDFQKNEVQARNAFENLQSQIIDCLKLRPTIEDDVDNLYISRTANWDLKDTSLDIELSQSKRRGDYTVHINIYAYD